MKIEKKTVDGLIEILDGLKKGQDRMIEDVARVLSSGGVGWDIAIEGRTKRKPEAFFDFFDNYRSASYAQCKAVCDTTDIDFLASMLSYQGRRLEHWEQFWGPEDVPFFIAGIESLLARCEK